MFFEQHAPHDSVTQRLDDLPALHDGSGLDTVHGAAIELGNDDVLSHIDQTTG